MGHDLARALTGEYLKKNSLTYDDYKKLTGQDFDPLKNFNGGGAMGKSRYNPDLDSYKNLFEEKKTGGAFGRGAVGTGEYTLKADTQTLGRNSNNAAKAQQLKDSLFAKDTSLSDKIYHQSRDIDEAKLKELGDPGVDDLHPEIKNYWVKLHNNLTGQDEYAKDNDFENKKEEGIGGAWRRNKESIIVGGGALAGGILGSVVPGIGTTAGALAGAALAESLRAGYKKNVDARKAEDAQRDFENAQLKSEQDYERSRDGNVFGSAGEGVVSYNTKDVKNRRKGTYEGTTT